MNARKLVLALAILIAAAMLASCGSPVDPLDTVCCEEGWSPDSLSEEPDQERYFLEDAAR
jgi:hypothetical protein